MATRSRRTGIQKEKGTPSNLTSAPDLPFVSIQRNSSLDQAAVATATSSKIRNDKVTSGPEKCFLCGGGTLSSVTIPRRHSYLKQVACFKTYVTRIRTLDGVETCASCLQDIKDVWELNQEIEAIKENISQIVDRVNASIPKTSGGTTKKSGRGSRRRPSPVKSDADYDLTFCPEIKEEPEWSGVDVDDDSSVTDPGSCFEMLTFFPEQDDENLPDSGPAIPSSSSPNSRTKRKSKVTAEEIIQKTVASEKISDDEQSENEGNLEEYASNLEEDSDQESDLIEGPPKKKRLKTSSTSTSTSQTLTCPHCQKPFKSHKILQTHIRVVHLRLLTYKCDHCPKSFPNTRDRSVHIKWNHTHETFPCSSCSKKLATQKRWAIHEATVCKVDGWTEERLQTEFNITLLPCPVEGCGKLFDRPSEVTRHLATHSGSRTFCCSDCGKLFKHESTLIRHICGQPSQRRSKLKDPSKPKPASQAKSKVLCDLCGLSMHPDHLSKHRRRVHEGQRDKACSHCELRFFNSNDLNRHVATVHERVKAGQGDHGCEQCGQAFLNSIALKNHRCRLRSGLHSKSHQCSKCPKTFVTRSSLRRHLNLHSKYGWNCEDCGRNFTTLTGLEEHQESLDGRLCTPSIRNMKPKGVADKEMDEDLLVDGEEEV